MSQKTSIASLVFFLMAGVNCGYGGAPAAKNPADAAWTASGAAVMVVDGVRFLARGGTWRGSPADLGADVTPIEVRIENTSGRPIRLLYERFALVAADGHVFYPLPLVPMFNGAAKIDSVQPLYASDRFFVSPRLQNVYRTLPAWRDVLPRDESLYRLDYRKWANNLPTAEIIDKGLPEGVLGNGGSVSGFLYFDGEARGEHELVFRADVDDSAGTERVAVITIPFRVS